MRRSRWSFTVGGLMVAVAISATGVWLWRRSVAYSERAHHYFGRAAIWSDTKKIDRDLELSERYRRAARYPWLSVEPEAADLD